MWTYALDDLCWAVMQAGCSRVTGSFASCPFLYATQAAQDAIAAARLKDVVDGGVTMLVPSSTTGSLSPAEKKVACASPGGLLLSLAHADVLKGHWPMNAICQAERVDTCVPVNALTGHRYICN